MSIPDEMITELRAWHRARETAARCNRNLLQYGAAFAAILGIEAGSGGVFALANALTQGVALQAWVVAIVLAVSAVGVVFAIVLAILLVQAYGQRREAERRADDYLERLIARTPERFLPKEEVTPELAQENG